MEMAPAINSATPPRMTTLESPKADKPLSSLISLLNSLKNQLGKRSYAVNAKGTVKPSERPIMASEMTRASIMVFRLCVSISSGLSTCVDANDSTSVDDRSWAYDFSERVSEDPKRFLTQVKDMSGKGVMSSGKVACTKA